MNKELIAKISAECGLTPEEFMRKLVKAGEKLFGGGLIFIKDGKS